MVANNYNDDYNDLQPITIQLQSFTTLLQSIKMGITIIYNQLQWQLQ